MKKLLVFIALCVLLSLLVACNDNPSTGGNNGGGNVEQGGTANGGGTDNGGTDNGGTDNGGGNSSQKEIIKGYLTELLSGYRVDPYSYLPESMIPGATSVSAGALSADYTDFVNVSAIPTSGFGEQWNMIIENIVESQQFFKALSVVDGLTTTSVSIFNTYLDQNPDTTAAHSFKNGIYTVSIVYEKGKLDCVLDYTQSGVAAQIALSMDVSSKEKTVRVQLGDANALCYAVSEDSYEFAIRYAGVRRAYFSLQRTDDGTEGHIYEYLTLSSVELCSAADFYITEDYVTAVGNKASGIPGFTGYICELYDTESGKLCGYEVRESLSALTFDTLWFDLADMGGITSLKYKEATTTPKADAAFFVNGKSTEWVAKKVGGLNPLTRVTRRYDIEFRNRFFYVYNATEKCYDKVVVSVPMLFVQEEYYDTLAADIRSENSGVTVSSQVASADLAMLESEYDTQIDVFIQNKEDMTVDAILAFIGTKKTFN